MSEEALKKKTGGNMSRLDMYNKIAPHAIEIVEKLLDEMRNGDNSNARIGAAKVLINKILPDIKSIELTGEDGKQLPFTVIIQPGDTK